MREQSRESSYFEALPESGGVRSLLSEFEVIYCPNWCPVQVRHHAKTVLYSISISIRPNTDIEY